MANDHERSSSLWLDDATIYPAWLPYATRLAVLFCYTSGHLSAIEILVKILTFVIDTHNSRYFAISVLLATRAKPITILQEVILG